MRSLKLYLTAVAIGVIVLTTFGSCTKKGGDDPVVSLRTRRDRFTNTWILTKFEKNDANQDLSGTTYTYEVYNSGTLKQTIEGTVFGFPTKTVRNGTWEFLNDEEDVRITIESDAIIYNVQRLANTELWLKQTKDNDIYLYYFEAQ